jgi:hypothetical protein
MKVFVVHIYDAADKLYNYYIHQRRDLAERQAAVDVVHGRFEDADPDFIKAELARVLAAVDVEPSIGRCHVRCDSWRAHVDEMQVLA